MAGEGDQNTGGLESADIWGETDIITDDLKRASAEEIQQRIRLLENDVRVMQSEQSRLRHELKTIEEKTKDNKEKIKLNRQLPHMVATVAEILELDPDEDEDGATQFVDANADQPSVVIKTTTRQTIFLPVIGLVDAKDITPNDLVGVNKDSYLVLDKLPAEYDSRVKAMEVDERPTDQYSDIGGLDKQIQELMEAIVLPMTHKERFENIGIIPPKGILMHGPPGTGKTMMARACAAATNATFLKLAGPQLVQMFIGDGAKIVRDAFTLAKEKNPAIVFIDEIDAVGSKRSNRDNTAVRMTLNQLLVELDGFEQNNGIVVICATNFPESLDKALTRPGRLDKQVVVPVPDLKGRLEILRLYADKLVLDKNVNLETLARRTAGMTGADLFNILNIAAVRSSAEGLAAVPMKYLETAFDRVVVGLERTNPMSDEEKRLTAFHEGGHTLVSLQNKGADPVHKATIMPRGNALGITWSIPEREKYSERLFELQARLEVLMGGKAAEELIFGPKNVTAGCTSDLRAATGLARRMVMNFGMSSADGEPGTLYMEVDDYAVLSDEAKHDIDKKTQTLLTNAYTRAAKLLKDHEKELRSLAEALIEYETLSAEEIQLAISGKNSIIAERRKAEEERLREPPQPKAVEEKSGASDAAEQGEAKPVLSSPPVQSEQKRRQTPLPARPKVTDTQAEE
mmetsp:Transcript_13958/g.30842  ORF Transcript_13958/g.30842 Transcript_13958/m.30842 type:complete len:686 (+) Transcript_13958:78-2135(+)